MEIIIGLDESGNFENRVRGCRFIGGFSGNYSPTESEQIEELLKEICNQFNQRTASKRKGYQVIYPNSLHGSESVFYRQPSSLLDTELQVLPQEKKSSNYRDLEREFKIELQDKVMDYLHQRGYEIYMFLDPYVGRGFEEIHTASGNMIDPNQGANLYERMAILTMYNQIIYTTHNTAQHYHLHFATRTLENSKYSVEDMYEIYEVNDNRQQKKLGKITTMSTYKTALSVLLYDKMNVEEYQKAQYSFHVKSINYHHPHRPSTPYLYIADIVCSYINRIWKEEYSIKFNEISENVITSEQLLMIAEKYNIQIRIYDGSEVYLRHMLDAVKNAELAQYYTKLYELQNSEEKYSDYYVKYWIPKVEEYIQQRMNEDEEYKTKAIQRVQEACPVVRGYMGPREYFPGKGLFIAESLLFVMEKIQDSSSRSRLKKSFFELYDICLCGYNHRGSLENAKRMIEMCEAYKVHVDVETYVAHTLRTMQYYFDSFQFEEAMNIGVKMVAPLQELKYAYRALYNATSCMVENIVEEEVVALDNHYVLAGKMYSSIAQAAAFLGKTASGNRYFHKALEEFEVGSPDYTITTSYYLHYFIAAHKKGDYLRMAEAYFGSSDLSEQFKNAIQSKDGGFKLLVFVKAFRIFFVKDRSNLYLLKEMIAQIMAKANANAHPWELIYANLYEAIVAQQKWLSLVDYEGVKERALNCIEHPECTIQMIQIGFRARTILKTQEDAENMFAIDCLNEEELKLCGRFIEAPEEQTLEELVNALNSLLTYMYQ